MSLKKDALLIPFAKIYFMLTGYLFQIIIARMLSKSLIGMFNYVNSVISPINMILIQSGIQTTSHFISKAKNEEKNIIKNKSLKLFFGFSAIIFIVLQLFSQKISELITHNGENKVYFSLALTISLFYSVYAVLIGSFNGRKEFKKQAVFDMIYSTLKVGSIAVALFAGFKLKGLFAGWIFATVIIVVLSFLKSENKIKNPQVQIKYTELIKYSLPIMISQAFFYVLLNIDTWMLGFLSESEDVLVNGGNYLTVTTISRIPYQIVISVTFIIFPFLSELSKLKEKKSINDYITNTFRYALLTASPFVILISVYPEIFLKVIYGKSFIENGKFLSILVVGILFLSLFMINNTIITALGNPRINVFIMIFIIPLSAFLNYRFIILKGMGGLVISTSISFFTAWLMTYFYIVKNYGHFFPLKTFLRFSFIFFVYRLTFPYLKTDNVLNGIISLALGGIFIYFLYFALMEFNRNDLNSIRKLIKSSK